MLLAYESAFRQYYWLYKLDVLLYVYILFLIMLKVSFAYGGYFLRSLAIPFFCLDLILTYFVIIGLYFETNNYLKTMYIYHGHYLFMLIFAAFANSIAFVFSTLYRNSEGMYNPIFGLLLMEISTILAVGTFRAYYPIMTMTTTKYEVVIGVISAVNLYVVIDSYLILKYRLEKFYKNEYIYNFFCMWVDWISVIWTDVFVKMR